MRVLGAQARQRVIENAQRIGPIAHEVLFRFVRRFRPRRSVRLSDQAVVSVVLVTNRPEQLDHAIASYDAQQVPKELILVTNSDNFSRAKLSQLASRADVTHLATHPDVTLGAALNRGVAAASGAVLAKFDDDDHYSATYLADALKVMAETGAALVGKKTYFVYAEELDETMLIYPGNEDKRVGRVAGGTIVVHRDVFDHVSFPERDLGEDVRFVRRAERAGFMVFSARPQGFLQYRARTGHTWHFDIDAFTSVSTKVGRGRSESLWG